jgi:threonine/homoserine efflux transporter RhtA
MARKENGKEHSAEGKAINPQILVLLLFAFALCAMRHAFFRLLTQIPLSADG